MENNENLEFSMLFNSTGSSNHRMDNPDLIAIQTCINASEVVLPESLNFNIK